MGKHNWLVSQNPVVPRWNPPAPPPTHARGPGSSGAEDSEQERFRDEGWGLWQDCRWAFASLEPLSGTQVLQVAAGAGLGGEGGTVVRKGADGRLQALPSTLSDMPAGPGKR